MAQIEDAGVVGPDKNDFSDISAAKPKRGKKTNAVTGTVLKATIVCDNWFSEGDRHELYCGSFEVDSVDLETSSGGSTATVKAVSVPLQSGLRVESRNRAWEDATLRDVCADIAENAGLELSFELSEDSPFDRVEQDGEPDLSFVRRVAAQRGAMTKVYDGKLVVFEERVCEAQPETRTYSLQDAGKPGSRLISARCSIKSGNTASSAEVTYKDPLSGKLVQETFAPEVAPAVGQQLRINARPDDLRGDKYRTIGRGNVEGAGGILDAGISIFGAVEDAGAAGTVNVADDFNDIRADAKKSAGKKAASALREQNKNETTLSLTIMGDPLMTAGATFAVEDVSGSAFAGKYIAVKASHSLDASGYITEIEAHRVLEGY